MIRDSTLDLNKALDAIVSSAMAGIDFGNGDQTEFVLMEFDEKTQSITYRSVSPDDFYADEREVQSEPSTPAHEMEET